jgi:hypothetical protein
MRLCQDVCELFRNEKHRPLIDGVLDGPKVLIDIIKGEGDTAHWHYLNSPHSRWLNDGPKTPEESTYELGEDLSLYLLVPLLPVALVADACWETVRDMKRKYRLRKEKSECNTYRSE